VGLRLPGHMPSSGVGVGYFSETRDHKPKATGPGPVLGQQTQGRRALKNMAVPCPLHMAPGHKVGTVHKAGQARAYDKKRTIVSWDDEKRTRKSTPDIKSKIDTLPER